MSLCPFSSSTSNIALGRACATTASITTAGSFWSPSSRSGLRTFSGRRGPFRCFDLPKTLESLLGSRGGGQARLDRGGHVGRDSLGGDEAVEGLDPPVPSVADGFADQLAAGLEVARNCK